MNLKKVEIIICQGLPGSGKSTWSKEWVNQDPEHRVRVNRDDIRRQLGPYWIPSREKLVSRIENAMIVNAISCGYNVVSDNTNLKGDDRFKELITVFSKEDQQNITLTIKSFLDVPIEECIKRDYLRSPEQRVGEKVIKQMAKSLK